MGKRSRKLPHFVAPVHGQIIENIVRKADAPLGTEILRCYLPGSAGKNTQRSHDTHGEHQHDEKTGPKKRGSHDEKMPRQLFRRTGDGTQRYGSDHIPVHGLEIGQTIQHAIFRVPRISLQRLAPANSFQNIRRDGGQRHMRSLAGKHAAV